VPAHCGREEPHASGRTWNPRPTERVSCGRPVEETEAGTRSLTSMAASTARTARSLHTEAMGGRDWTVGWRGTPACPKTESSHGSRAESECRSSAARSGASCP
jgi:hypothetical protein